MADPEKIQARLREQARKKVAAIPAAKREPFLIDTWMVHDARWFTELAQEAGMATAQRVNRRAAHELGKYEARRVARMAGLPPVKTREDYLLAQEVIIEFLGPHLLEYDLVPLGENAFRLEIRRCFAAEKAMRGRIDDVFECGIFERVTGWLVSLQVPYEISPAIGRCMKCAGQECSYTLNLKFGEA